MSTPGGRKIQSPDDTAKRPTKRLCTTHELKSHSEEASLPSELWALVMPFLPYKDNIRCSILNKTFLTDVAPRVKLITVFSPSEMKVGPVARRFASVETAKIACLFRGDHIMHCGEYYSKRKQNDPEGVIVSDETIFLTVPFLSSLPALKEYWYGGYVEGNNSFVRFYDDWDDFMFPWDWYDERSVYDAGMNKDLMATLVMCLGGAYRSGLLKDTTKNADNYYICTHTYPSLVGAIETSTSERCPHCCAFFENFPLDQVSSIAVHGASNRDFCPTMEEIFRMIMKRPGGKKAISSKDFFCFNMDVAEALNAFEKFGLVPKISRADFVQYIREGKISRHQLENIQERLLQLGLPLQKGDVDLCRTLF